MAAALTAQSARWTCEVNGRPTCAVSVDAYAGSSERLGLAIGQVQAISLDGAAHAVQVTCRSVTWENKNILSSRSCRLGPGERMTFHLPLPTTDSNQLFAEIEIDGQRNRMHISTPTSSKHVGLLLTEHSLQASQVKSAGRRLFADRVEPQVWTMAGAEAVDDWRLYTGYEFVAVAGDCGLSLQAQEALRRYVFAGGRLLLAEGERLTPGPLLQTRDGPQPQWLQPHGLGWMAWLDSEFAFPADEAARELTRSCRQVLPVLNLPGDGLTIPGLQAAPVRVFLVMLIVFAVLAGPVNFLYLRRRRRMMFSLVTIPVLGGAFSLVLLGYTFWRDGWDTRGTEWSYAVLDQARHEAAAIGYRTLFCGFSTADFAPSAETAWLSPMAQFGTDPRGTHGWAYDSDRGMLSGNLLPARVVTPLAVVTQGVRRERVMVQRQGEALRLHCEGFVPTAQEVLLRDLRGAYWHGQPDALRVLEPADAERELARVREELQQAKAQVQGTTQRIVLRFAMECVADQLAPGQLLLRVQKAPWLPTECQPTVGQNEARHTLLVQLTAGDFRE